MWKECIKCGKIKCLWAFSKQKKCEFGVCPICKKCINKYHKEYRKNNKEKLLEYSKEYRKNNKDMKKIHDKKYYEKNKEEIKESCEKWRENNKEEIKEYSKEYRKNNKEKLLEYSKEYRKNNKEKIKKDQDWWNKKYNKDLRNAYIKNQLKYTEKVPTEQITPEMIELKRQQLKLFREIRQGRTLIK